MAAALDQSVEGQDLFNELDRPAMPPLDNADVSLHPAVGVGWGFAVDSESDDDDDDGKNSEDKDDVDRESDGSAGRPGPHAPCPVCRL